MTSPTPAANAQIDVEEIARVIYDHSASTLPGIQSGDDISGPGIIGHPAIQALATALHARFEAALAAEREMAKDAELDAGAILEIRGISKAVTGGNCTFVDDDVHVLGALALNAIKAGLFDGVSPQIKDACIGALASSKGAEDG